MLLKSCFLIYTNLRPHRCKVSTKHVYCVHGLYMGYYVHTTPAGGGKNVQNVYLFYCVYSICTTVAPIYQSGKATRQHPILVRVSWQSLVFIHWKQGDKFHLNTPNYWSLLTFHKINGQSSPPASTRSMVISILSRLTKPCLWIQAPPHPHRHRFDLGAGLWLIFWVRLFLWHFSPCRAKWTGLFPLLTPLK